jgi:hypothetical protein
VFCLLACLENDLTATDYMAENVLFYSFNKQQDQVGMRRAAHRALEQFGLAPAAGEIAFNPCAYRLLRVERDSTNAHMGSFVFKRSHHNDGADEVQHVVSVPGVIGTAELSSCSSSSSDAGHDDNGKRFYLTEAHASLVAAMTQDHCAGRDILLVGAAGSGKSQTVRRFALDLGYSADLFNL